MLRVCSRSPLNSRGMKRLFLLAAAFTLVSIGSKAQDKGKLVKFSNITEVTVGFQLGKTTQVSSLTGNDSQIEVAGYKVPSPHG